MLVRALLVWAAAQVGVARASVAAAAAAATGWTGKGFPDIRGTSWHQCAPHMPTGARHLPYICDPDGLLNRTEANLLNARLHALSLKTPCHCQRPSQCMTDDRIGNPYNMGFIVAVAMVKNLRVTIHDPSDQQIDDRAQRFLQLLQGRWALGDCGNSAIVFIWDKYHRVYISTGRVTTKYLTNREIDVILAQIQQYADRNAYSHALARLIESIDEELRGSEARKVDIGTLSLIISVAVAVVLVCIITGCVCAFRCCGNLKPPSDLTAKQQHQRERANSLKMLTGGGGATRSPKLAHQGPTRSAVVADVNAQLLGYYRDTDTTMV